MNMTCNIDQRGRKVRFVSDILFDGCGAALLVWGVLTAGVGLIVAGVVLSVVGGFMMFEGSARLVCVACAGHQDAVVSGRRMNCRTGQTLSRKNSIVFCNPISKSTLGPQPRVFLASVISGRRCFGSSTGSGS